jgi:pyruvate/2-oxoglutarate dehydrogenase complex dihydrolipoamide dehydrogenase (E3) component
LARDGVELLCCGDETRIRNENGQVRLTLESHGERYDVPIDKLLVAVGRAPNVEGLDLEAAGVAHDRSGVQVDDHLRTTNRHIYAAGDIASRYKFTHAANFLARVVLRNALFPGSAKASALTIPWCTYTRPELAHVGAHQGDGELETYVQEFRDVDRAILDGEEDGFVKIHVKKGTDEIAGATVVARNAGDLISEITLAMSHGIGLGKIQGTIHPYPTLAEAMQQIGDQYNRKRLTPFMSSLLRRWLAWTR